MFLPVCAHLYRDVSVYPWPVNIINHYKLYSFVLYLCFYLFIIDLCFSLIFFYFYGFDCLVH